MADADPPLRPPATAEGHAPGPVPAAAVPVDLTGRTLGDFQIRRKIGAGGMGQVYLARQLSLKRDIALKLLRDDLASNPTALKRFEAEAHAVAQLNHPNIVQVYSLGEYDGLRYMALEYVEGRNLRDYIERKGPPDLAISLSVMRQVALALLKAHDRGIVHRDIKPENILLTRRVEVKVTDFGLSRFFAGEAPAQNLTQSGVTLGTPLYMSPEQVVGRGVDSRSDIYSFGVTCYHLLAGEPPFRGHTAYDVAMKHVHERPRPLSEFRADLPAELCDMVHKMMAKNADERYQSAREILRDVARIREGIGSGLAGATVAGNGPAVPAPTAHSIVLSMSGSTSGEAAVPGGATLAMSAAGGGSRTMWRRWLALGVVCSGAAAGGALLYGRGRAPEDAMAAGGLGLTEVKSPEPPSTARERELRALLHSRETQPPDLIAAAIDLGLLYVREGRFEEAEGRFRKLEAERLMGPFTAQAQMAGRLGQGIALAHRDQPAASNKAFEEAVQLTPKGAAKLGLAAAMRKLLLAHPPLSRAVSEALDRNAANLKVKDLTPRALEQLRHARESVKPTKE